MALRTLVTATAALVLAVAIEARAQGPLVPTALVEDVKSATAGVQFMDYVGNRQVIQLGPQDVLVLSYLRSCEHETITGGMVTVGMERSTIQGGRVVRTNVPCDGGRMRLSAQQASQSAAAAFRLQSADSQRTLYARSPVVQLPRTLDDRTLVLERTDRRGERYRLEINDSIAASRFYDLAGAKVNLARGGTYDARIGSHKVTFRIDPKAKSGRGPVVSRLVRFQ
ncbi:MAG: hypothetical protein K2Y71_09415 [Xanthobacteraceae bacterium]|nr:hypothetical protein [Xanthobacteraceae bacterium]